MSGLQALAVTVVLVHGGFVCEFRRLRPCNPIERGHAFRSKATTFSDEGDRAPLPAW